MGGDCREQRFSPLDRINLTNAASLGLAWSYDIPTRLGQEATPVVVGGVMYVATDGSVVKALDARTGRLRWSYDPAMHALPKACCGPDSRGVAVWNGRVYVGVLDGRLIALDARTGRPVWSVMTVDPDKPYTITGAPRVVRGRVIIGNGGAELGVRGYVTAYDAVTGAQAWRFYTVPGDPASPDHAASDQVMRDKVRATWTGEPWRYGGGGTVWDAMAYDPELNLLYIGVGNGSPWNPAVRSPGGGDNLFLASIVALDPDTGAYVWHYQTTPGEAWDYTATQSIILADLTIAGRPRKVLMQAPKNGFFYVLDRATGELISADAYTRVTWASGVDLKTGRPIEDPQARYYLTGKPAQVRPASTGGHNWQPMAFSPATGLAYIPALDTPGFYAADSQAVLRPHRINTGIVVDGSIVLTPEQQAHAAEGRRGWLSAWDPVEKREVWRVDQPDGWTGGVLATGGGLVFQGSSAGVLSAYDAATGKAVWRFDAQAAVLAAPMTYSIGGEQYVAVMVGWGGVRAMNGIGPPKVIAAANGPNRILVFKLGAGRSLPPEPAPPPRELVTAAPPPGADPAAGAKVYGAYCFGCHGMSAVSGGVTPDLRYSPVVADRAAFASVVRGGALRERGMADFSAEIDAKGAEDLRAWLLKRAADTRAGG